MSQTETRWTLGKGLNVAHAACIKWGLDPTDAIVGSLRRRAEDIGDIELVCPAAHADRDGLFRRVNTTMANPWQDESAALFERTVIPDALMGRIERGLKPGFLAASLVLTPWPDQEIACQIYRYTKANEGWVRLMRTGPREFGMWFLGKWKDRFGIPKGVEHAKACIDGHLVDSAGQVIAVETEAAAFAFIQVPFIEPQLRSAFVAKGK
jgi:hypothetical protein